MRDRIRYGARNRLDAVCVRQRSEHGLCNARPADGQYRCDKGDNGTAMKSLTYQGSAQNAGRATG